MNAVSVESVTCRFGSRAALSGVSFAVGEGGIFGLLGPNGGGKTTLFRVLATLLSPDEGRAAVFGRDAAREAADVRRLIGVVFQHPSLDGKLTLEENLACQGRLYGLSAAETRARSAELLSAFGVADRAGDFVETLSGGLQRRGEIAKSLLHRPKLLLMDEPSTGLDPAARRDLWTALEAARAAGATVLLTTHLMEEADRCGRVAILSEGRLVAEGEPAALKQKIGGEVLRFESPRPEELRNKLREKFQAEASVVDGVVVLERRGGHAFVPQVVEAFPGLVEAVYVGKPTLEDVFMHETGRRFYAAAAGGRA